jgi:hypothetical protein
MKTQNIIAEDPATYGMMFVLVILSSDKTMVSVGTSQYFILPQVFQVDLHRLLRPCTDPHGFYKCGGR